MRPKGRRRTLFSLIGALGLAASVFLYFQLFSVEMIDFHKRKSEQLKSNKENVHLTLNKDNLIQENIAASLVHHSLRESGKWNEQNSDDCDSPDCDDIEQKLKPGNNLVQNKVISNNSSMMSTESVIFNAIKGLPQGAKRELAALYRPSNQNTFTCIHSKEVIAFDWVNDDYCDCADGSDEPGTSACINNIFYCTFQGGERKYIPAGRVNDGICDCCDGSDEWKKKLLPEQVKLDDKPHYGYYQAPCINHCEQEMIHEKELANIYHQGKALKKEYIEAVRGQSNPNQLYGPDGEFLTLSKNCYDIKSDKYEYKVCPFKEIRQQMFPEPSTLIGQIPEWIERGEKGHWTLKMSQGDSKQCPGSVKRLTFIRFECGLKDEVLSIHETEVCQYTIHFSTPAAC